MVNEQELKEHAGRQLAKFKVPGRIWFRNEPLPVGADRRVRHHQQPATALREG